MRILIVDDETSILTLLKTALSVNKEHICSTAASGAEALELIDESQEPFDCFLLDIQMPEMDGVELCGAIRDREAYRNTPIIMLTAMSQMDYVNAAFQRGATDYITKPFDFRDLRERLKAAETPTPSDLPELPPAQPPQNPAYYDDEYAEPAQRDLSVSYSFDDSFRNEVEMDFTEVDRLVTARVMDNYLRQTARSSSDYSCAFAVTISDRDNFLSGLSTSAFLAFLSMMAWNLSRATKDTGALITYRGRGTFICVENGNRQSDLDALAASLQSRMASQGATVSVGRRVRQRLTTAADAVDYLYKVENAFDLVEPMIDPDPLHEENRAETQRFWPTSLLRHWRGRGTGDESSQHAH